ncbi:hypothetical protein [Bradyrhizobium sp. USDA 4452]
MRALPALAMGALLAGGVPATNATAVAAVDPVWSTGRIARLPAEVQDAVHARCAAGPEAGHYFATFANSATVIHLDYSALQCANQPRLCTASGCLHQTFAKMRSRYVLTRSDYE